MLYDQAQMIQTYADTYVVTKDSFYSDIVDDIATYVERDLRHKVLYSYRTTLLNTHTKKLD